MTRLTPERLAEIRDYALFVQDSPDSRVAETLAAHVLALLAHLDAVRGVTVKQEWIDALETLIEYADRNAPESWRHPATPTRLAIPQCRELLADLRSADPARVRPAGE